MVDNKKSKGNDNMTDNQKSKILDILCDINDLVIKIERDNENFTCSTCMTVNEGLESVTNDLMKLIDPKHEVMEILMAEDIEFVEDDYMIMIRLTKEVFGVPILKGYDIMFTDYGLDNIMTWVHIDTRYNDIDNSVEMEEISLDKMITEIKRYDQEV